MSLPLDFDDLITPAPSGIGGAVAPLGSWLSVNLQNAATVGLTTTAWQAGGMARTLMAVHTVALATEDVVASKMAAGGFLDFADGVITYTDPISGQTVISAVTPDPSDPSTWPTPGVLPVPGWLDALADSTYNCQRIQAVPASGTEYFANTNGQSYGPFGAGTCHVANALTGATYSNTASATIAASSVLGGHITAATATTPIQVTTSGAHGLSSGAVVYIAGVAGNAAANGFWAVSVVNGTQFTLAGSVSSGAYTGGGLVYSTTSAAYAADIAGTNNGQNAAAGVISQLVTSLVGVACWNLGSFLGVNYESNGALVARCRLRTQSLSPNGPKGAYAYFALQAYEILEGQAVGGTTQAASLLTTPITQATVTASTTTGAVQVVVTNANASGGNGTAIVSGVTSLAITGAANASPIVLTVASTSAMGSPGANVAVQVAGVLGNVAANGYWQATLVSGTTLSLNGSAGNAAYTGGGVLEGGDLGLIDSVIQANVVPLAVTATVLSAIVQQVTVAVTAYTPAAKTATVVADISAALAAYFAQVPTGGFQTGVATPGTLPYNDVLGAVYQGVPYLRTALLTLAGGAADVAMGGATSQPVIAWSGGSPQAAITVVPF